MSMADRLRSQLVIIGEGDPGDLNQATAEEVAEIKHEIEDSCSHRDASSALALADVVMAEKRKEG